MTTGRTTAFVLIVLALALAVGGCGEVPASPSPQVDAQSTDPSPSARSGTTEVDLSAIGCATDDPEDLGELTGVWSGSEGGVYYIRHVGDCVWWFGTELDDIESGVTGQPGFANVASGRVVGTHLEVEYADLPMGHTLGGGGLTFEYVAEDGLLVLIEQRGDWTPFGAGTLTRIDPSPGPDVTQ